MKIWRRLQCCCCDYWGDCWLVRYCGGYVAAVEDAILAIALVIIVTLGATVVGAVLARVVSAANSS